MEYSSDSQPKNPKQRNVKHSQNWKSFLEALALFLPFLFTRFVSTISWDWTQPCDFGASPPYRCNIGWSSKCFEGISDLGVWWGGRSNWRSSYLRSEAVYGARVFFFLGGGKGKAHDLCSFGAMVKTPLYGGLDSTSGWGIRACGRLHGFGLWHKGTLSTRKDSFRRTWMLWVDFRKRKGWTFFKYREGGFLMLGRCWTFPGYIYIYIYLINYYCIRWCIYFHVHVFVFVCIILSYLHFGTSRIPLRFFPIGMWFHRSFVFKRSLSYGCPKNLNQLFCAQTAWALCHVESVSTQVTFTKIFCRFLRLWKGADWINCFDYQWG